MIKQITDAELAALDKAHRKCKRHSGGVRLSYEEEAFHELARNAYPALRARLAAAEAGRDHWETMFKAQQDVYDGTWCSENQDEGRGRCGTCRNCVRAERDALRAVADLIECDSCGFTYDAMHTLADGSHKCPECGSDKDHIPGRSAEAMRLVADRDALKAALGDAQSCDGQYWMPAELFARIDKLLGGEGA